MSIAELVDLPLAWEWGWSGVEMTGLGLVVLLAVLIGWKVRRGNRSEHPSGVHDCYGHEFEWTCVELDEVKGLDQAYYEDVTKELGELGFQKLADIEYLHLSKAYPAKRTVVRWFVIDHGQISAVAYQIRGERKGGILSRLFGKKEESRVLHFQTAMSDGSFVLTSNAGRMVGLESADQIKKSSLEGVIDLKEHQDFHIERVKQFCSDAIRPVVAKTREQLMRLEAIQYRIEQDYWFGPDEPGVPEREEQPGGPESPRGRQEVGGDVEQANA